MDQISRFLRGHGSAAASDLRCVQLPKERLCDESFPECTAPAP